MDYRDGAAWHRLELALQTRNLQPSTSCGLHECEPDWAWSPRLIDHDLWFVQYGRGWASINSGAQFTLEPGVLVWLRPGDRGEFRQHPRDRLTVLQTHFSFRRPTADCDAELEQALLPNRRIPIRDTGLIASLFKQLIRTAREDSVIGRIAAPGQLLQLLAEVYRQDAIAAGASLGQTDSRLQDAIELIRMHPNRRQTLHDIAGAVGLPARQLSRLFSRQLGMTFRSFSVEVRLARAQELLRESPMSVSEIARALGYEDHALFSRQFRARFGQPPTTYRASVHRSGNS